MFFIYLTTFVSLFIPGYLVPSVGRVWPVDILFVLVIVKRLVARPQVGAEYSQLYLKHMQFPYAVMIGWFVLVTVLTFPFSPTVHATTVLIGMLGRMRPLLFMFVLRPYLSNADRARKFGDVLLVLLGLQFLLLFAQSVNLIDINTWYTTRVRPEGPDISYIYATGRRAIGSLGNPNDVGTFLTILGTLGWSLAVFGKGLRRWLGGGAWGAAFFACVFMCKTRQGTLALLLGAAILTVLGIRYMRTVGLSLVGIAIAILAPLFFSKLALDPATAERFAALRAEESVWGVSSIQARLLLWPEFLETYGAWAMIGKGMGGIMESIIWDSGWLMLLVAGGVPLVGFFIWWSLTVPQLAFRQLKNWLGRSPYAPYHAAAAALLLPMWSTNLVNNTFSNTAVMIAWICVFSLSIAMAAQERSLAITAQHSHKKYPANSIRVPQSTVNGCKR